MVLGLGFDEGEKFVGGSLGEGFAVDLLVVIDDFALRVFMDGVEEGGIGRGVVEGLAFG